ncbi:MAG: FMN-binding glutamate synthase family protein [Actinomycetota bacterium]|nr:FMN-binding glutamate synthase family protein [Actinomycetota bacterium]
MHQRAKGAHDKIPFGPQLDVYQPGHEFLSHSLRPVAHLEEEPKVQFGAPDSAAPYHASRLNISAMSYGALSSNGILALNIAASRGGFAHNTGEGGISPYHVRHGGDLVWQVGTGYFGCRDAAGAFDPDAFAATAAGPTVKMVEIKLNQGAKPGHGGILPAEKLTPEIAAIRGVPLGHDVVSPSYHTAFNSPRELVEWVDELRKLTRGKPVGIKLCLGRRREFLALCKAMIDADGGPDFITIDGSEGGTGAAPLELTNSVGLPLKDGLTTAHQALLATGRRSRVRLIATAKVSNGFDILHLQALGADICNAARPMMLALGCIQARKCHNNECPVGIATQDPQRGRALVVDNKAERVRRFHEATIRGYLGLIAGAGLEHPDDVDPSHLMQRKPDGQLVSLDQEFHMDSHALLIGDSDLDDSSRKDWELATTDVF